MKEATNLYDPSDRDSFVPASRLAKLSHEEVSRLDVSPDNPMWHTHRKMESGTVDTWSEIENWVEGKTTEELLDSKKFRKEFPDFRYNLQTSKRVLFWDDIKRHFTEGDLGRKYAETRLERYRHSSKVAETITSPSQTRNRCGRFWHWRMEMGSRARNALLRIYHNRNRNWSRYYHRWYSCTRILPSRDGAYAGPKSKNYRIQTRRVRGHLHLS